MINVVEGFYDDYKKVEEEKEALEEELAKIRRDYRRLEKELKKNKSDIEEFFSALCKITKQNYRIKVEPIKS